MHEEQQCIPRSCVEGGSAWKCQLVFRQWHVCFRADMLYTTLVRLVIFPCFVLYSKPKTLDPSFVLYTALLYFCTMPIDGTCSRNVRMHLSRYGSRMAPHRWVTGARGRQACGRHGVTRLIGSVCFSLPNAPPWLVKQYLNMSRNADPARRLHSTDSANSNKRITNYVAGARDSL